ncbi:MAG: hypothetical protein QNJ73_12810 [Gammaproteobacteria bacterium]|nr:hypothetical protein [Gammaproteobacteria bacterium]
MTAASERGTTTGPIIGPITCVTFTAPDLDAVRECYSAYLDYRVVEDGEIDADLADAWQAPGVAGRRYLLLAPAAAEDCFFRAIEGPANSDYRPFSTYGWNAAELMVENVDAMAERLHDSPFRIVGEPQDLSFSDDIRAMQILGPGQELLYLTQFKREVPGLSVPMPRCSVDRTFIVILGGPAMDELQSFMAETFAIERAPAVESRVKGMSAAFGLSPEHRYPIAALTVAGQCLIEVDQMPAQAHARATIDGELPAGISIVSFAGRADAAACAARGKLYEPGGACQLVRGVAGELIEVIPA